jgi:hypothetical protein
MKSVSKVNAPLKVWYEYTWYGYGQYILTAEYKQKVFTFVTIPDRQDHEPDDFDEVVQRVIGWVIDRENETA